MFTTYRQPYNRIQVIRANAVSDFRMDLLHRRLRRASYDAEIITAVPFHQASQFDTIICCRPGDSMLEYLKICQVAGKQVIIDLDDDFNSIPKHNPAYVYTGAGHPTYLNNLKQVMSASGLLVTYASAELANRYHKDGVVIPNCYDEENPAWNLPKRSKRGRLSIGWSGTTTHREDFKIILPVLKRLFAQHDNLDLVVSLDDAIYNEFVELPESRKTYLPGIPYQDYPAIFAWIDILVVPLRDTHFNRAKSDIKLVECGASRTVYVASDLPVYREWGVGGMLAANTEQAWESALTELVTDAALRKRMAKEGFQQASTTRTSKQYTDKWIDVIDKVINHENPLS